MRISRWQGLTSARWEKARVHRRGTCASRAVSLARIRNQNLRVESRLLCRSKGALHGTHLKGGTSRRAHVLSLIRQIASSRARSLPLRAMQFLRLLRPRYRTKTNQLTNYSAAAGHVDSTIISRIIHRIVTHLLQRILHFAKGERAN